MTRLFFKSVVLLLAEIISCNPKKQLTISSQIPDKDLFQCLLEFDTVLNSDMSVVLQDNLDSTYDLKVKMYGKEQILGYGFDCSVARSLIPKVDCFSERIICLKRGFGQDFREYLICSYSDDSITYQKFEIALCVNLNYNLVVYRDYEDLSAIVVKDILSGSQKRFKIKDNLIANRVADADCRNQIVSLTFDDGTNVKINYLNGTINYGR